MSYESKGSKTEKQHRVQDGREKERRSSSSKRKDIIQHRTEVEEARPDKGEGGMEGDTPGGGVGIAGISGMLVWGA